MLWKEKALRAQRREEDRGRPFCQQNRATNTCKVHPDAFVDILWFMKWGPTFRTSCTHIIGKTYMLLNNIVNKVFGATPSYN